MSALDDHYEALAELLKCPLCSGLLSQPVVNTMCGHVFCDACINASIEGRPIPRAVVPADTPPPKNKRATFECPTCKLPCFRWSLKPAAPLVNTLEAWRRLRTV
jgi:hypothetical protein